MGMINVSWEDVAERNGRAWQEAEATANRLRQQLAIAESEMTETQLKSYTERVIELFSEIKSDE